MPDLPRASAALSRMATVLGIVDRYTVAQVAREYGGALERFVRDGLAGRMSRVDFRRAHKALLRSGIAEEAYREGMREAGSKHPDEDMEEDDRAAVGEWITEQVSYVDGYADAIAEAAGVGADEDKRDAVLARVALWVDALRALGMLGKINYLGDPMLTFDGDDGSESCAECQRYKGQRHKKSWWDKRGLLARNGNPEFGCGRWSPCEHHYYLDSGELAYP